MTDHKLCLLAAKAEGYTVEGEGKLILRTYATGLTAMWCPLTFNAHAFDLMVDCKINVEFENHAVIATSYCDREAIATDCRELFGTDKHAATRRAIVRAAAAMGDDK